MENMNNNHKNKNLDKISKSGITNELRQIEKIDVSKDERRLIREGLPFLTERQKEKILGGTAMGIWGLKDSSR